MKKLLTVVSIILTGTIVLFLGFIYLSNPIVLNGSSTYEDPNGSRDIVFHLYNEGISKVSIKKVLINNQVDNKKVDLGISYDTPQIVQSGTRNEMIKFFELGDVFVNPRIQSNQVKDALNKKEMTPIHYGIRIKNFTEPIESITIKYKYLGLPITKEINVMNEI
ncbi:hypothetical protein A8F94_17020 [Bacillus sp. FJAT-27225]|uniref:hypothetical protein n=1 Tax=Bacillus sp. FJAT-27225 TaxID=1743144 RepID=UPI00080C21B6|nr:hypothetical protein [Bacillus sp. FJAT-27225]OCA84402.1 hypothetical protein A8F94_17020 [Bacillus sp. FJAT-27225]